MVLISSISKDISTNDVIDWFNFFDIKWMRINYEDNYFFQFGENGLVISNKGSFAESGDITSYWFRRGKLSFKNLDNKQDGFYSDQVIQKQKEIIDEYLQFHLAQKISIGGCENSEPNKLIVLEEAKKTGLNIPVSFVVEKKEDLINLLKGGTNLITKTIAGSSMYQFRDGVGLIYTNPVNKELVDKAPDEFFPSLIQYEIQKKYELRIFFLGDKFWAMAIFSQKDDQTKGDYRRYNQEKGNRNVPFLLPDDLKEKLYKLMSKLGLNCGSIDLIVSTDNTYYFLEVNPIGQFGNVSHICNFQLEKEVAQKLCEK